MPRFQWCLLFILSLLYICSTSLSCSRTPPQLVDVFAGGFWEYVSKWSTFHIDTAVSLNHMREFRSWMEVLTDEDKAECRVGSGVLALLSAIAVDYDSGREKASRIVEEGMMLLGEGRVDNSTIYWDWEGIERQLNVMRFLMGDSERSDANGDCFGTGLRVFLYHSISPDFTKGHRPPLDKNDRQYLPLFKNGAPLTCGFGMYASEVYIPLFLSRQSDCIVDDPELANIFLLPTYFKCLDMLDWLDDFKPADSNKSVGGILMEEILDLTHRKGFLDRRGGVDHVALWSWGKYPCEIEKESFEWRQLAGRVQNIQVEAACEGGAKRNLFPSFSPWKDVIIPGYVDKWRIDELRKFDHPWAKRSILLSFHGRHSDIDESYQNVSVRTRILEELSGKEDVSVGGFIDGYHEVIGRSKFCVAPRGITPWTIHFYVAVFGGCIPVVISDRFELPFQSEIDYSRFVVRWGEGESLEELYQHLKGLGGKDGMRGIRAYMKSVECWFDYWSGVPSCSPYIGVLKALKRNMDHLYRRYKGG
ncbi:hypothetical protein FOL47_006125 [Perkinsus chesapeaki]|uniref:Exostosin GT47 domain-containing protein n=1 Tax=Perkinsus chesapeaki TaxID=330153 RepID=A0A7J6MYS3_PERCH|nr:hypothetical protein FOL47_006125 [Perkinsus chesapeaki]